MIAEAMPNRRSRHPWRVVFACALLARGAVGCEEKPPDAPAEMAAAPQGVKQAAAARQRPADAGTSRPRAVASALAELRNTKLELLPRALPAQSLAVGRGRVAQLSEGEVIVRRLPDLQVVVRGSLSGSPSVIELLDGDLLALGRDRLLRLEPSRTRWREYARVTLLPGRFVYAHLQYADRFWILQPASASLFRYDLNADGGALMLGTFFDLPSFDGRVFGVLKDASLLYTTAKAWQRSYSAHRHVPVRGVRADGVVRVLPAKRVDQVWVLMRDGTLVLAQLGATLAEVKRVASGALPFDAASNDEGLAVLELEQAPPRPRRWRLAVYTHDGQRRFNAEVPDESAPGTTDDWVAAVTRNKNVAVSRHEPWVAVGGSSWLRVWNMKDGSEHALP